MQAVVYENYGPPEMLRLVDVAKPTPGDDELLVKVHATTVTTGDCNLRNFVFVPNGFGLISRLMFGFNAPKTKILGLEFAGEVEAVGANVTLFKPGDAVFGIDSKRLGAYAEYKCIPEGAGVLAKPANLTFEQAAAIPNGALTALVFLRNLARLQAGQTILIIGASGSVGSAAVQLAKHYGAVVTGVCSGANVELVRSLGADSVIDYTQTDFTTQGKTYDVIFDTVGKSSFTQSRPSLAPKGCYLAGAGGIGEFGQMAWTSLFGSHKVLAGQGSERKEDLAYIRELAEADSLKPVIDRSYPLQQIAEAHRYVDTGRKKGNVVITVTHTG
jgi:NADPH:quinone reductase-like Zn-dependent oxidoreductase